jgi:maltose O-acetyltransferase
VTKLADVLREELDIDGRDLLGRLLIAPLPHGAAARLRARLLRAAGFAIGEGTLLTSGITMLGGRHARTNVRIGRACFINDGCVFDAAGPIVIGDEVNLGQGVLITTGGHLIGTPERRAGLITPEPVHVGSGAWLSSRCVVLPGVTVGAGAIVAAGAIVTRPVEAHTLVGGVPARLIRRLDVAGLARVEHPA